MKKEKLVISLIVMIVLLFAFTVNSLATNSPVIQTSPTNSASVGSGSATKNSTSITPSTNSAIQVGENAGSGTNQTITPGNNLNTNSASAGSSYRNLASSTNTDNKASGLPYTGSSYGVVFVIIALGVSAVYAYKKVSDYNM